MYLTVPVFNYVQLHGGCGVGLKLYEFLNFTLAGET